MPVAAAADLPPSQAAVSTVAVPVFEFEEDIEERLAIMTIDGGLTEEEARAALGLPPALPSFYAVVDEVTGGRYPAPEDWLLATRVWVERCRSAHWCGY